MNIYLLALTAMVLAWAQSQAIRTAEQQPKREAEITITSIADISGDWGLLLATDDEKRIPKIGHYILRFRKGVNGGSEETDGQKAGQYAGTISSPGGKEMILKGVNFDGQILIIRTREISDPDSKKELPGLMLQPVGDHFEGYWVMPGRGAIGPKIKLVRAKK